MMWLIRLFKQFLFLSFDKGGGGAPPPSNQTVTQTNLPEYARPYFEDIMKRAQTESLNPYPTYTGPRLQGLSGNQSTAINEAGNFSVPGQIGAGTNMLQNVGIAGLQNQTFDQNAANQYMSPYIQNSLQPALDEIQRNANMQMSGVGLKAAQQGALGGYRHGVQEAEMQRNANKLGADVLAQGYQSAYQNAQGQFNADQQRRLGGLQVAGSAGQGLGSLGQQEAAINNLRLQNLQTTGLLDQQQGQQALDMSYNDFMNANNFGRQQLNFLSGILRGVPTSVQADTSTYTAPPNPYSQLLGLGIAGAGLSKMT